MKIQPVTNINIYHPWLGWLGVYIRTSSACLYGMDVYHLVSQAAQVIQIRLTFSEIDQ